MSNAIHYVLGFVFSRDQSKVWLMRKRRPKWQAGRINGIGGHIEPKESVADAMRRECREETGVDIPVAAWTYYAAMSFADSTIFCFRAHSDEEPKSKTDEEVYVISVRHLPPDVIPNLHWLIPMALNMPEGQSVTLTEVTP